MAAPTIDLVAKICGSNVSYSARAFGPACGFVAYGYSGATIW